MGRNAAITHPMRKKTDWPTLALIICCYVTWLVLLFTAPIWISILLLAPVIALQSSLQHEVLHGHPFRNQRFNEALVWPSLNIVIPFTRFRDTHLAHHHDANLTDPYDDPESNYFGLGKIKQDQVIDYAKRRGISTEVATKWLGPNIAD